MPGPRAFAEASPFPLDPFQLEAIEALDVGESVLVAAPTGAGKTVVADLPSNAAFLKTLCQELKRMCGTGGATTGLAVHIDYAAGHGFTPVAVAFNCWINRRTRARIYNSGEVVRHE